MVTVRESAVYTPGVCNIGPAEIRRRRSSGWFGLTLTVLLLVAFVLLHMPGPWRLFVVIPAGVGAIGFLQAAFHFCVRFGATGLFNVGNELGTHEQVHEAQYRRKDQRKAVAIVAFSAIISVAVALLAMLLP
jgi:hypothetical protein